MNFVYVVTQHTRILRAFICPAEANNFATKAAAEEKRKREAGLQYHGGDFKVTPCEVF